MKKPYATIVFGAILMAAMVYLVVQQPNTNSSVDQTYSLDSKSSDTPNTSIKNDENQTEDETTKQLLYLIEEEKLAHDVYTVLYEKYGARVFGNILESESTHQERVLALLSVRNIADPRSSEIGVFKDSNLQKFYDDLIARGMQNETEAYRVGVTIEETDIADITEQLATTTEQDVIDTLEDLRKGSENHLRAFNRQL